MLRIFVTGGSGFLGSRIIKRLQGAQHRVTALSRSEATDLALRGMGAEIVRGSLADIQAIERALPGQDAVVHAASPVEIWGPRAQFQDAIVAGTQSLFAAASRQSVPRFIHISSEAVLQDREPLLDIDETAPYPETPNSAYGEAKRDIEQWLRQYACGPHVVILRPPYIWGVGSAAIERIAAKARSGLFVWVDGGKVPFETVHADNAVEAVICALTRGVHRGVYIITDDRHMSAKDFLKPLMAARGITLTNRSVRGGLARPVAVAIEAMWRGLRVTSTPPLSRFQQDFVGLPRRYRIDRAKAELGYRPVRSLDEGLAEIRLGTRRNRWA